MLKKLLLVLLSLAVIMVPFVGVAEVYDVPVILGVDDSQSETVSYFDTFILNFQKLCKAWEARWTVSDMTVIKSTSSYLVGEIDGVIFVIQLNEEQENIVSDIYVKLGDADDFGDDTYGKAVKCIALVSALEYEIPASTKQRSSILSDVGDTLSDTFGAIPKLSEGGASLVVRGKTANYYYMLIDGTYYFGAEII